MYAIRVIVVTDSQTNKHTHRQYQLQYTVPQLASAQCNEMPHLKVTRKINNV